MTSWAPVYTHTDDTQNIEQAMHWWCNNIKPGLPTRQLWWGLQTLGEGLQTPQLYCMPIGLVIWLTAHLLRNLYHWTKSSKLGQNQPFKLIWVIMLTLCIFRNKLWFIKLLQIIYLYIHFRNTGCTGFEGNLCDRVYTQWGSIGTDIKLTMTDVINSIDLCRSLNLLNWLSSNQK